MWNAKKMKPISSIAERPNGEQLPHTQMPAHMHSLIPVKRQIHIYTQKAQTEAIIPQPAAQNEARKENNAALKRGQLCAERVFSSQ
jgi:hypothetical protein